MMISRNGSTLFGLAVVAIFTVAAGVEISVYNINPDELTVIVADPEFGDVISKEAASYCVTRIEECGAEFSGNLTTEFTDVIDSSPNANVTVTITASSGSVLPDDEAAAMFKDRKKSIYEQTGHQIISADGVDIGKLPDNPANWIIISIFFVLTLVLLFVVLYLSKHKVNHEEEHYEHMKNGDDTAGGEIAA